MFSLLFVFAPTPEGERPSVATILDRSKQLVGDRRYLIELADTVPITGAAWSALIRDLAAYSATDGQFCFVVASPAKDDPVLTALTDQSDNGAPHGRLVYFRGPSTDNYCTHEQLEEYLKNHPDH